jgi:hypothetical protein
MALSNLFRINFPYGIQYNVEKETFCFFNREYTQLGSLDAGNSKCLDKLGVRYFGLTPKKVEEIIRKHIKKDLKGCFSEHGNIKKFYFYDDATNPSNEGNSFETYFKIIAELSMFRKQKYYTDGLGVLVEEPC